MATKKKRPGQDVMQWYTQTELAVVLGLSPQRVGQLRQLGQLSGAIARGGRWFYPPEAVQEYRRLHPQN